MKVMQKPLLKDMGKVLMQKESMVIEDSMMVANRVVQFQRGEAQIVIAEAMEAKRLAERELLERENLEDSNKHAAVDRNQRKKIKSFLMDVVNLRHHCDSELWALVLLLLGC